MRQQQRMTFSQAPKGYDNTAISYYESSWIKHHFTKLVKFLKCGRSNVHGMKIGYCTSPFLKVLVCCIEEEIKASIRVRLRSYLCQKVIKGKKKGIAED